MKVNSKHKLKVTRNMYGGIFISIAVVIIILFAFVPMFQSLLLSFKSGRGVVTKFCGFNNYTRLFLDPKFLLALKNTFTYLIVQVPMMLLLALFLAVLLNDNQIKYKGFFRTAIFIPCITSLVSYSILFKSIFSTDGLFNRLLVGIHIINEPIPWLLDPFWAKVVIIIAITWRWTGYNMIFYLAGLQNIDPSVYEAARIDGASKTRQFFSITAPLLQPIIIMTTVLSTNGTLKLFAEVVNLTGGGPANSTMTVSQYIYDLSFTYAPNFGYASTVSYAIVVIVAILSFAQFKIGGEKREKN